MEDLESRQLLSGGTLWKVTLHTATDRPGAETMLTLQDGAPIDEASSTYVTTIYEEKPDGMSGEDFLKSLVTGTISGTVWAGDPSVETPVSFAFPQDASTTQGDQPVYIQMSGDDTQGYYGSLSVDDYFDYEDPAGHTYNSAEWTFSIEPAPRVSVEAMTEYQASEDNCAPAVFNFHADGSSIWAPYVVFTVGGSATAATLDENGNVTNPEVADYTINGAEPVAGSPGEYKAYFGGATAQVSVVPLNDSRNENTEDVQLTIVADDTVPAGTLPAYADPAGNAAGLLKDAAANITDLRVTLDDGGTAPTGPAPTPAEQTELNDLFTQLESDAVADRDAAQNALIERLRAHPGWEQAYLNAVLGAEGQLRMQAILAAGIQPTFTLDANNVLHVHRKYTANFCGAETIRLIVSPEYANYVVDNSPGLPIFADLDPHFDDGSTGNPLIPKVSGDAMLVVYIQYRKPDPDPEAELGAQIIVRQDEFYLPVHTFVA